MDYKLPEFNFDFEHLQKFLESKALMYCVVLLLVLKISTIAVSVNLPFNIFFADITKSSLVNYVNQTRQSLGLGVLTDSPKLDEAAKLKAEDMVLNQYFAHTSPNGITPWFWFTKAGYNYKYAGENLAIGFYESEEVYNAWLNSPDHKANLLNPNYKEIGTGIATGYGNNNAIVVVQLFGSQKPVATTPAKSLAKNTNPPATVVKKPVTESNTESVVENPPTAEQAGETSKVLAQTTEAEIQPAKNSGANNAYLKLANYLTYNYAEIIQNAIYGVSLVVIGLLLIMIFSNFNFKIERRLVFRSVMILGILVISSFINKETVILLMPHRLII